MSQMVVYPALFATFYYKNDQNRHSWFQRKQPHFVYHIVRMLGLRPIGQAEEKTWEVKDKKKQLSFHLHCFTPTVPYAKDVTVVELEISALGEDSEASECWPKMLERLELVMNDKTVGQILGYTLIYQAVIPDSAPSTLFTRQAAFLQISLTQFLGKTRRPHLPAKANHLSTTSVLNGRGQVWLLNMPNIQAPESGNQLEKGSVYLALCFKSANNDLVGRVLFGEAAHFFIPELIAHKAYNQIRQYRLADKQQDISHQITNLRYNTKHQLKNIEGIATFDRLRISLARQQANYEHKTKPFTNNAIMAYHATQLEMAQQELEFIVEEGQNMLQAADLAIAIKQTRLEWWIGLIFGLLGIGLAIAQFVDADLAIAFFAWVKELKPLIAQFVDAEYLTTLSSWWNDLEPNADSKYYRFWTFTGQLIVTGVISTAVVIFFLLVWFVTWLLGWLWAGLRRLWRWIVG